MNNKPFTATELLLDADREEFRRIITHKLNKENQMDTAQCNKTDNYVRHINELQEEVFIQTDLGELRIVGDCGTIKFTPYNGILGSSYISINYTDLPAFIKALKKLQPIAKKKFDEENKRLAKITLEQAKKRPLKCR